MLRDCGSAADWRQLPFVLVGLALSGSPARAAEPAQIGRSTFQSRFLTFCDLAAAELEKEITPFSSRTNAERATHHMPFFEDAHAVRALAVGYDLTGKQAYLDACRRWSRRMVEHQSRMIPRGAYYMNHGRAPAQDQGQWNVADSGSIAMGVLATAHRCQDAAEKARLLDSASAFAELVTNHYLRPGGGISNGLWPQYSGPWWCSSATFGTFAFLLHDETGDKRYLNTALAALDWMVHQDFRTFKPITFEQRPAGTVFYTFEFYLAALKHLPSSNSNYQAIVGQVGQALDWMAHNQKSRGASVPDYLDKNVDMAGMPCLMYGFAAAVSRFRNTMPAADAELDYIGRLLLDRAETDVSRLMVWEVMTWGMLSHAERLSPGTLLGRTAPAPAALSR